jgi:anti-sigma factor RsiW
MHSQYTELMSLILDDEASAEQTAEMHAHLATCQACAATWARWRAMDAHFRRAPMLAPSHDLADQVLARLKTRSQRRFWKGWLGVGIFLAWIAMAGAVVAALAGVIWWGISHPLQAGVTLSAATQLVSSFLWPVRGAAAALTSAGLPLGYGIAGYFGVTCALLALWVWVVARRDRMITVPAVS